MSSEDIPADVVAFVGTHIRTVGHMETLALAFEGRERSWSAAEIAERLYVSASSAEGYLADLSASGLVSVGADGRGAYVVTSPALADTAERAVTLYRRKLVPMTHLIHRSADAARQFSEAFRFRRS